MEQSTLSACIRCASVHPTCCRMDPASAHLCFPLSCAEAERIRPHALAAGLPWFYEEQTCAEFVTAMHFLFPDKKEKIAAIFPLAGRHYRLPTSPEGSCVFLRSDGCILLNDARPWYCRLFPIWVRKGNFDRFIPSKCLVTREARTMADALALVGLSPHEARRIYEALCRDWGLTAP